MKRVNMAVGLVCLVVGAASTTACGGAAPATAKSATTAGMPGTTAPATVEEQIALGQKLYGQKCASCHGANGEGDAKDPPVVGKDALPLEPRPTQKVRKAKFMTAADVGTFVKSTMPADAPGTLTDTEALAILAFDLHANGVKLEKMVDPAYAAGIKLH